MANWTRDQLLVALNLYCQLDFGKFHQGNPLIIEAAKRIDRTPSALAMKLCNFASLDPAITASGRKGLQGASALDRKIWGEFQQAPDSIGLESQALVDGMATDDAALSTLASTADVQEAPAPSYYAGDTAATVKVRRGQHFFRKAVLSSYEGRCCMSGLRHPDLLLASHIVPWSQDANNRLNPANGLCLSALHDRAFDQGLITVTPDLLIRVSSELREGESSTLAAEHLLALEGKPITLPHKFAPDREFLSYHSQEVFKG
jgi:hypothetical protein